MDQRINGPTAGQRASMAIKLNTKHRTILIHITAWGIVLALPHFLIPSANRNAEPEFLPSSFFIITNIYHIGLFYFTAFLLYPLFFNKRNWWLFILSLIGLIIGSFYLKLFMTTNWYPDVILHGWTNFLLFFPTLAFLVMSIFYRLIIDKIENDKKQKEIIAEQLSMKLKFLRSQINPHFIFNVLANLVSLARKRSEQMEPALIKLSDLMRYMLYESDEKRVSLSAEIDYLKSYIELQELRFGNDVNISVNMDLTQTQLQYSIGPMLLIPFVENAFKHGMGMDEPFIEINLRVDGGVLKFEVKNRFADADKSKDESSGIGLGNVRSRLLLLYPKAYQLEIKKENNLFHVQLTLQLK
jgi:two-component system, LytTR family, sensor kinase